MYVARAIKRGITNKIIIDDLKKSNISVGDAINVGWFEAHSALELKELGFQVSINKADIIQSTNARLVIPYYDENNKTIFHRLRLYPPLNNVKYLQPIGIAPQPFILPQIWRLKHKNTKSLIIAEGEKKALCLFKNGFSPIGLAGVWSWCKDGKMIEELDNWNWQGRAVFICFDNDRLINANVLQAEISLAINLALRGARVRVVELPRSHIKMGADDFIVKFSTADFEELINKAKSIYEAYPKEIENSVKKALTKALEQKFNPEIVESVTDNFAQTFKWRRSIVKNFVKNSVKKEKPKSLLEQAIEIIYKNIEDFFKDEQNNIYVILKDNRYYPLKNSEFKRKAYSYVIKELKAPVSPQTIRDALSNIEAAANEYATKKKLYVRVGEEKGDLYYSLGDFKAVRISKGGWQIVDEPPIFRHFAHQKIQVIPDESAKIEDIMKIFDFVNIEKNEDKILLLTYLVTAFVPNIPHTVLILHGEQGSGKSSLQRLLLELIDPSNADLLALKGFDDLHTSAVQHYFLAFDNLNYISQQVSDEFCRFSTGGGFSKRKLYTDNDEVFYKFKRVLCLNGINVVATSPDLLDRAILIKLNRIPLNKRTTEMELQKAIKLVKPKILGAIFEILANIWGRATKPPYPLPRMADYAVYAYHIAELLGFGGLNFLKAYADNQRSSTLELIESEPVANLLIKLINKYGGFSGTAEKLLNELKEIATSEGMSDKDLPKNATWLKRKLNVLKPNLEELGITINEKRDELRKTIEISKVENTFELEKGESDDEIPF